MNTYDNMEDGGTTGTPAVRNLPAREASRNGDAVVRRDKSYPTSIWTAVQLEHQQFITYLLGKQAVMVMLWYDKISRTQHQYGRQYNWNTSSS